MIDCQAALPQDLFQVAVAESIAQIPADAEQDDLGLVVTPFEGIEVGHEQTSSQRRVGLLYHSGSHDACFCNSTQMSLLRRALTSIYDLCPVKARRHLYRIFITFMPSYARQFFPEATICPPDLGVAVWTAR